jgi:hypothetical protein
MEMQPGVCVIGVSYDGILPSVVLACDEIWFGLFCGYTAKSSRPRVRGSSRGAALSFPLKALSSQGNTHQTG